MLTAPPVIPATIPGTLTWAFTPHGREICTCSSTSTARPARQANAITGTRPARDTRSGSSNVAWIFARSANNRTCEVSSRLGNVVDRGSVSGGLAAVDVRDLAGDPGIHPDSPAGVLDGQ